MKLEFKTKMKGYRAFTIKSKHAEFIGGSTVSLIGSLALFVLILIVFALLFGISFSSCTNKTLTQHVDSRKIADLKGNMDIINLLKTEHQGIIFGQEQKMSFSDIIIFSYKKGDYSDLEGLLPKYLERISSEKSTKGMEIIFPGNKRQSFGKIINEVSPSGNVLIPIPESSDVIKVEYYDSSYKNYELEKTTETRAGSKI